MDEEIVNIFMEREILISDDLIKVLNEKNFSKKDIINRLEKNKKLLEDIICFDKVVFDKIFLINNDDNENIDFDFDTDEKLKTNQDEDIIENNVLNTIKNNTKEIIKDENDDSDCDDDDSCSKKKQTDFDLDSQDDFSLIDSVDDIKFDFSSVDFKFSDIYKSKEEKKAFFKKSSFLSEENDLFENSIKDLKYVDYADFLKKKQETYSNISLVNYYYPPALKRKVQDFISIFKIRFDYISKILRSRPDLDITTSISRINSSSNKSEVSIIGYVFKKNFFMNRYTLTIEDLTGRIDVIVNEKSPCYEDVKNLVEDDIVGITGNFYTNRIYANKIILPDIPINRELGYSDEDSYAIFISDVHIGSINFLENEFKQLIDFISGKKSINSKIDKIAKKIKYIIISGDLVSGVGIYPGQDEELVIKDIYEQYDAFSKYIEQIPDDVLIFICAGNHDATRLSEPQPPISKEYLPKLWEKENVFMMPNPFSVKIGVTKSSPGYEVMAYHGYSYDWFVANVDSIRKGGGYDRIDLVMEFLLKRRHLVPVHSSNLYIPDKTCDPMLIKSVPDIFVSGHVHNYNVGNYNNVKLIVASCFESRTSFQEKVGHHPQPGRVPIFSLKNNKISVLKFYDGE